jgi:hypothetical protein
MDTSNWPLLLKVCSQTLNKWLLAYAGSQPTL